MMIKLTKVTEKLIEKGLASENWSIKKEIAHKNDAQLDKIFDDIVSKEYPVRFNESDLQKLVEKKLAKIVKD